MDTKSELTIIIPTTDAEKSIPKLLTSLLLQDYPAISTTKLYLVDGGSTDGTRDVALSFSEWLDITVVRAGVENLRRNTGARLAASRYLLFLDADIEIHDPTLIRGTLQTAKRKGLHCATTNVSGIGLNPWIRLLFVGNNAMQKLSRLHRPFSSSMFMLFDRETFEALGRFDEKALVAEDYLLSRKVARAKFAVIPGRVATTNQRLQQLGHIGLIRLFLNRGVTSPQVRAARLSG